MTLTTERDATVEAVLATGATREFIANLCGVSVSAVSKWMSGINVANSHNRNTMKAYLRGIVTPLPESPDTVIERAMPPEAKPTDNIYLVNVPSDRADRFNKLMRVGGFVYENMDD